MRITVNSLDGGRQGVPCCLSRRKRAETRLESQIGLRGTRFHAQPLWLHIPREKVSLRREPIDDGKTNSFRGRGHYRVIRRNPIHEDDRPNEFLR